MLLWPSNLQPSTLAHSRGCQEARPEPIRVVLHFKRYLFDAQKKMIQ